VGLLKTAATAAVASSVHGRVQRRQQARWAAQDQRGTAAAPPPSPAPAPAPPAPAAPAQPVDMGERLAQLAQLGELMKAGLLTEAEFEQQKARILNG
jgi:hypothetical protein